MIRVTVCVELYQVQHQIIAYRFWVAVSNERDKINIRVRRRVRVRVRARVRVRVRVRKSVVGRVRVSDRVKVCLKARVLVNYWTANLELPEAR